MLNVKALLMAALCGVWLLAAPTASQAQWGGGPGGEHRKNGRAENHFKEVLEKLNLSDAQRELLKRNKNKSNEQSRVLREAIKQTMQELGDELKKKDLDMVKINILQTKFKNLRDQMADKRFEAILEVRKILTQEQFEKFIELTDKKKDKD